MPAKRRYGQGSIYLSAEGWRGALSTLKANGTRGRKTFRGTSRRDIEQQFKAYRDQVEEAQPVGSTATLAEYLTQWLDGVRDSVRPATHRGYTTRMALVSREAGGVRLCDLTPGHVQQLTRALLDRGLQPSTVANVRSVLSATLEQARVWGLIPSNPVRDTRAPRLPKKERPILSPDGIKALLEAADEDDDPWLPLWTLLLLGGLRLGEALGLRWTDLDQRRSAVHVRQQVQRVPGGWDYHEPKGGDARTVVVPPLVLDLVRGMPRGGPLVFCDTQGQPYHQARVRLAFRRALASAGLPATLTPHSLRHTTATEALRRGINPRLVSAHLGHSKVGITLDLYSHVDAAMSGQVADQLAGLLPLMTRSAAEALPNGVQPPSGESDGG
jgi:integrase